MRKLLFLLIFFPQLLYAQSTTVSGQVTDSASQSWNNGTYVFQFVPRPDIPPTPSTWSGGVLNLTISGSLNATGGYTQSVPDNATITPTGSKWRLQVCSGTTPPSCFASSALTITGSSQTVNVTPPPPSIPPGANNSVYTTAEVSGAGVGSQIYVIGTGIQACSTVASGVCTLWVGSNCPGTGTIVPFASTMTLTYSPSCAENTFQMTLTGNPTLLMTGTVPQWSDARIQITQGAGGGFTITAWPVGFQDPPPLQSAAGARTSATFECITSGGCSNGTGTWQNTDVGPTGALPTTPTAPNGSTEVLGCAIASSACVAAWTLSGVPTNAQTGTTYPVAGSDRGKRLTFSNAGSIAVTVPQAGSGGGTNSDFTNNIFFQHCNIGAGTATVTPTTSTVSYSNGSVYSSGAASVPLATGQCAWLYSDNSNYFGLVDPPGNWALTTASQSGWAPTEATAAINGTITNNLANQSLISVTGLANSTATEFSVVQPAITNTVPTPGAQFQCAWNNASLNMNSSGCVNILANNIASSGSGTANILNLMNGSGTSIYGFQVAGGLQIAGTTPEVLFAGNNNSLIKQINGGTNLSIQTSGASTISIGQLQVLGGPVTGSTASTIAGPVQIIGGSLTSASSVSSQFGGDTQVLGGPVTANGAGNAGAAFVVGGATSSTNAAAPAGPGELSAGPATGGGQQGLIAIIGSFIKGAGTTTLWSIQNMTSTAWNVNDAATSASTGLNAGIAITNATPVFTCRAGSICPVNADAAVTIGHTLCMSTTTAGDAHDSAGVASCAVGQGIGTVVATSGTYYLVNPNTLAHISVTASTTLPIISYQPY